MAEFELFETGGAPVKAWVKGVPVEEAARRQLENVARLPFVHSHVAAMPDVHYGRGATVGSVIATKGAIIPAAVGVDIGCENPGRILRGLGQLGCLHARSGTEIEKCTALLGVQEPNRL